MMWIFFQPVNTVPYLYLEHVIFIFPPLNLQIVTDVVCCFSGKPKDCQHCRHIHIGLDIITWKHKDKVNQVIPNDLKH